MNLTLQQLSLALARIFHSRRVARATCPCRQATSLAEARRQTSRVASLRLDKVPVQVWSASCRPVQAGCLFHPFGRNQYQTFALLGALVALTAGLPCTAA